jgi:hypothetical protein
MWQVYAPLALGLVGMLAVIVVVRLAPIGDASLWADLSVVLIAVPFCLLGVVMLAALLVALFGLTRLISLIPPYSFQAQQAMARLRQGVLRAADWSVKPIIATQSTGASAKAGVKGLGRFFRRRMGGKDAADGRAR